jgi:hypothetical protein
MESVDRMNSKCFNGEVVKGSGRDLISSTVPPLSLTH